MFVPRRGAGARPVPSRKQFGIISFNRWSICDAVLTCFERGRLVQSYGALQTSNRYSSVARTQLKALNFAQGKNRYSVTS